MGSVSEFPDTPEQEKIRQGNNNSNSGETYLRAGDLSMIFESGSLRYISAGQNELMRMIYAAVRNKDWLTIHPLTKAEKIRKNERSFTITFRCLYRSREMAFSADYTIEGKQNNSIILTMEGETLTRFEKNRIGFCALHTIEGCSGKNCVIEHTDGSTEESFFPEEISPHQVFKDIKSMRWLSGGISCKLDFEGDIFETEDQRNWTDGSYKTYSTPLSLAYPVTLEKGAKIFQRVSFQAEGSFSISENHEKHTIIRVKPEETFRLPDIGVCQSSYNSPPLKNETSIIRSLRFDHYRADLHMYEDSWQVKADKAANESVDFGFPIELALFFDDNMLIQIADFVKWYSHNKSAISRILLYHKTQPVTPGYLANKVIPTIRNVIPEVKIVTGTNANFAELNRNRPGDTGNDNICYSIHPQEHASDNKTLIENLKAQHYTVRSAMAFTGKKGITVSPVTLQRRFNANISFMETPWTGKEMPPQIDNRMMSLFGACWTVASLKYLSEAGASSITFYETFGERGIYQGERDPAWPSQFPSYRGMIFPVYHVFRYLLGIKNYNGIKCTSSNPLIIECLALSDGRQAKLILTNFTEKDQPVSIDCYSGLFRIRSLNSSSFSKAVTDYRWNGIDTEKTNKSQSIFILEPYSVNFIEGWIKH
jgi:hypothetical protein